MNTSLNIKPELEELESNYDMGLITASEYSGQVIDTITRAFCKQKDEPYAPFASTEFGKNYMDHDLTVLEFNIMTQIWLDYLDTL